MISTSRFQPLITRTSQFRHRAGSVIGRYPFISFLLLLALLVGLAAVGDKLRQPEVANEVVAETPTPVSTFTVGGQPTVTVQAKIEKSGVIQLVAQTGGVVQKIKTSEGQVAKKGASLFIFSSTYQGANAPAVTRQISQKSYQFLADNYQSQVDAIARNKEIARVSEAQSSEMREINRKSLEDTRTLISLNESQLQSVEAAIREAESTNVNGSNDQTIATLQGSRVGLISALANLRSGLRTLEYMSSEDQEPAKLGQLGRDATIQQLELQEKTLTLNKDIAHLQLKLAYISEATMYPASPITGTVERIHVKVGQAVNPGTVLATIRGTHNHATAVVLAGQSMAKSVSAYDPSIVTVDGQKYEVMPRSISQEPTDGALFSILYTLPEAVSDKLTNNSYIEMNLPISVQPTAATKGIFIPLDAVYQSQTAASVNIVDRTQTPPIAKNVEITLGQVTGQYVEVTQGLAAGDAVILDRTVVAGDQVEVQ